MGAVAPGELRAPVALANGLLARLGDFANDGRYARLLSAVSAVAIGKLFR